MKFDLKNSSNLFPCSKKGRLNSFSFWGRDSGGNVFIEEMLSLAPFAKILDTGSEEPLQKKTLFLFHALQEKYFYETSRVIRTEAKLQA